MGGEWNQSIQNKEAKEGKEKGIQEKQDKYYYYQKVQHKMVEMNTNNSVIANDLKGLDSNWKTKTVRLETDMEEEVGPSWGRVETRLRRWCKQQRVTQWRKSLARDLHSTGLASVKQGAEDCCFHYKISSIVI